jgi:Tol biopolymer transport system component
MRTLAQLPVPSRRPIAVLVAAVTGGLLLAPSPAAADPPAGGGQGLIVFGGETEDGTQLWTVQPDGTHAQQITDVAGDAVNPDWSPDGRSLVFEWALPDDAGAQLAFVDPDGGDLRVLPLTQPGCVDANPAFTADGRRVVYLNDCPTESALYSRAVDGTGRPQRITPPGPDGYDEPNPSPDGRLLSYVRVEDRVEYQQALTVSRIDGTQPRDLLPPSEDVAVKTGWSPDSSHIVLTTDANQIGDAPLDADVATIAVDGSDLRYLTDYPGGELSAFAGSYSPDGRWIVFRRQDDVTGESGLWRIRPDGTAASPVFSQEGLRPRFIDWAGAPCR